MRFSSLLLLGFMSVSSTCFAAEKLISDNNKVDLNITIYNRNLALVQDERSVALDQGINEIAFEGVATQIKPETAMLEATGVRVLEQNYDYAVLTYINMIEKSVGQTVKTVRTNPITGENIFENGRIVSSTYGSPVLEFGYGIESNYPGRVVFDELPATLRKKPTLVAKVHNDAASKKNISLAYLTSGISWSTNYVAKVVNDKKLDITGWVTIKNESGIDYNNAKIQLVAGQVNQVYTGGGYAQPRMAMMAKSASMEMTYDSNVAPESLGGFQLYTLPEKSDLKDQQTKQIAMIEKEGVPYKRIAEMSSQFSLYSGNSGEFRQAHPNITYVINNKEEDNLGIPLPAGVVRFYENDSSENMQFTGENSIGHTAKGEELRLNLGSFFDIYANGKIVKVEKKSERKNILEEKCHRDYATHQYTIEVTFNNSGKYDQEVKFTQSVASNAKLISESFKSTKPHNGVLEWVINIPADGKQVLNYVVESETRMRSKCN